MSAFLSIYDWAKWLHLIALISWMAGIFYLPRLFVYHTEATPNSESSQTFQIMEAKLLRIIMTPAMLVTWVSGICLMLLGGWYADIWLWIKLAVVFSMTVFHFHCAKWRKEFLTDTKPRSGKFFRLANEIPTVLMMIIVLFVVFKPF